MNSSESTFLVVLAGGLSSRMGTDKRFLQFQGGTLLEHVSALATQLNWECIYSGELPWRNAINDQTKHLGPMGGVCAVVETLPKETILCFVPVDMPALNQEILLQLQKSLSAEISAVCFEGFRFPFCFKNSDYVQSLCQQMKATPTVDFSVGRFQKLLNTVEIETSPHLQKLLSVNVNTPEDWKHWLGAIRPG